MLRRPSRLFSARIITLTAAASLLIGCSAAEPEQLKEPVGPTLRSGPALTEAALEGMYMSRTSDDPTSVAFVKCLDNFVLRFDEDADVTQIFTEISAETDSPLQEGNIAYFTDQSAPDRYKRLVDNMIDIDGRIDGDIFNFDSNGTCVLSPEDCPLGAEDANIVRLYWTTVEHGSMGCFE